MKPNTIGKALFFVAITTLLASGCETRQEVAYSNPPPMFLGAPPPEEVVAAPPSSPPPNSVQGLTIAPEDTHLYVWLPGVWVWRGGWVWEPGHWVRRPYAGAVWVPPQVVFRNGHRVWVPGYWR